MRIILFMMDADQLAQQAEEYLTENRFEEAKTCLKEAATLAPLRVDIRDMLVDVIAQESEYLGTGSRGRPRRRRLGRGPRGWRFALAAAGILLCLVLLAWGALIVKDFFDRSAQGPREILEGSPTPTVTPTPTPTPPPTPDPRPAQRAALIKEIEGFLSKENIPSAVAKVNAWLATDPPEDANSRKSLARRLSSAGEKRSVRGSGATGSAKQKDFQSAESALLKAIELDPDYLKSYLTLALNYIKLREPQRAVDNYRLIRERSPGSAEAKEAERRLTEMRAPLKAPGGAQ